MPRIAGKAVCIAAALAAFGGACRIASGPAGGRSTPSGMSGTSRGTPEARGPTSNVTREDYAGSAACSGCHPSVSAAWQRSAMHRMTRDAPGAEVRAPFDGTSWRFKDDAVMLEQRNGARIMHVTSSGGAQRTFEVTRVLGGRTREDFAGIDVDAKADGEVILPVSFVFATGAFRYKGYSVMIHERATLRPGPVWSKTCIFCHNTVPEMDRFLGAIAGDRGRPFQGETVDPWLPTDRRSVVKVVDDDAFARSAYAEIERLGGAVPSSKGSVDSMALRTISAVRAKFDAKALVEVGIGCEACHGGAKRHTRNPAVLPSLVPAAPWLEVALPKGKAQAINHVCARCHQVLFSGYPFTWEGGRRDAAAGGSHINSGEARDFLLGGCASEMACTTCHDPHGASDPVKLGVIATTEGNKLCTRCHAALADRARLRAHAHHDPEGTGGVCVSCHMPRKNMGLDGRLTRYHRIGSPTDPARVLGDRPLECALCHTDRSVGALVDAMEAWWPVRYPRQRLEELYGPLDANVIRATLERGKPHERAVAIASLGEARARDAVPLIGQELLDEYPLVREWAKRALVSILGRCDVDLTATDETIARQAAACANVSVTPAHTGIPHDEVPED